MNTLLALSLLSVVTVLAGCASHPAPELRPYTAAEQLELSLEALNRRGLSFDEYQAKKAELLGEPRKTYGFDQQGEMNAERGRVLQGRAS
jgi:hypothetical protein